MDDVLVIRADIDDQDKPRRVWSVERAAQVGVQIQYGTPLSPGKGLFIREGFRDRLQCVSVELHHRLIAPCRIVDDALLFAVLNDEIAVRHWLIAARRQRHCRPHFLRVGFPPDAVDADLGFGVDHRADGENFRREGLEQLALKLPYLCPIPRIGSQRKPLL